jgi:threonylcarbamoyladenosine tRNA methylthiotransferase MtaB
MASGIKDGIVPYPERRRRVKELIALSEEQEALFRKSLDGKKVTVLWDSCKDNVLKGYSENYLSYERKGTKEEVGTFSSFISH